MKGKRYSRSGPTSSKSNGSRKHGDGQVTRYPTVRVTESPVVLPRALPHKTMRDADQIPLIVEDILFWALTNQEQKIYLYKSRFDSVAQMLANWIVSVETNQGRDDQRARTLALRKLNDMRKAYYTAIGQPYMTDITPNPVNIESFSKDETGNLVEDRSPVLAIEPVSTWVDEPNLIPSSTDPNRVGNARIQQNFVIGEDDEGNPIIIDLREARE